MLFWAEMVYRSIIWAKIKITCEIDWMAQGLAHLIAILKSWVRIPVHPFKYEVVFQFPNQNLSNARKKGLITGRKRPPIDWPSPSKNHLPHSIANSCFMKAAVTAYIQ